MTFFAKIKLLSTYVVFLCCSDSGNEELRVTAAPLADAQENRWQHPEKQKTLIHTAPVLSPVLAPALATPTSSSSAGSAIRAVRSRGRDDALKNNKEVRATSLRHHKKRPRLHPKLTNHLLMCHQLERLDRQYQVALESLAEQKSGAMRWMARQKVHSHISVCLQMTHEVSKCLRVGIK